MTFEEVLDQAMAMLQRQGRVSYRTLKRQFALDDSYLADLKAEIIDVHQGTIRVESEHGKGSTFTFTVPVAKAGMDSITMTTSAGVLSSVGASQN